MPPHQEEPQSPQGDAYNHFLNTTDDVTKRNEVQRLELQYRMMAPMVERWVREFDNDDTHDDSSQSQTTWLDLGCGPGHDTALLCRILRTKQKTNAKIIGMDINLELLQQAKDSYQALFGEDVVSFVEGSAIDIPLQDASVDRVFVKLVLQHLPAKDRTKVLSELYRILKPGGKAWIVDVDEFNHGACFYISPQPPDGFREAMELFHTENTKQGTNDRQVAGKLPPLLRQVGFSKIQMKTDSVVGGRDQDCSVAEVLGAFYNWKFNSLLTRFQEEPPHDNRMVEKVGQWFQNLQQLSCDMDSTVMYPLFLVAAEK